MEKNKFYKIMKVIFEDKNLKEPSKEWLELLFLEVKSIEDDKIEEGIKKVMKMGSEEWSKKFGYGGKPSIVEWLSFFKNEEPALSVDNIAAVEVEKILYEAKYCYGRWTPEHPTTAMVINSFRNGLKTIHFDLFDSFNDKKQNISFYKKDLLEKWLSFNARRIQFDNHKNLIEKDKFKQITCENSAANY